MSRFACTTYAKTLIELRTCVRGGTGQVGGVLIKMQTLDDTITCFTPPLSIQEYQGSVLFFPLLATIVYKVGFETLQGV